MTRELITIGPEATLTEALQLLKSHRIRRLLVVADDALLGVLTPQDIERAMPAALDPTASEEQRHQAGLAPVRVMMTPNPLAVSPEDPLEDVATIMRRHKIGGLPVTHGGRLVGIITETNLLGALMELLGTDFGESMRINVCLPRPAEALFEFMDLLREFDVDPRSLVQHCNCCRDQRQLTLRVSGRRDEELLEELGKSGIRINRVLRPGTAN
ncbi:MAG: hypothetical protein BWK76_18230 [Desulfobulbaceae bacterium A2]|nr:MAG: hypothetical protein BWK76_18230 [Desulfobulbaceae bacterium A2]